MHLFKPSLFAFVATALTCLTVAAPSRQDNPLEVLGSVEGTFKVDHDGGAIYEVPLALPPGTAGMAPKLSLAYNSHQEGGLLGTGWGLTGFSAITRCPVRRLFSGTLESFPVTYTDADRFCFDGSLLVAVEGRYGDDGTLYHTETESWALFQSHGRCGSGPCSFSVSQKNGETLQLGGTEDSRIEAVPAPASSTEIPAGSVRVWTINRREDPNNNYILFTYSEGGSGRGDYFPKSILYTGNSTARAKLMPQRAIDFIFTDKHPDTRALYQGGALVLQGAKLLSRIDVCIAHEPVLNCRDSGEDGLTNVTSYTFDYDSSPSTLRPRLRQIARLGLNAETRFPPLRFDYQEPQGQPRYSGPYAQTSDFTALAGWTHPSYQQRRITDLNGDGRLDLIGFNVDTQYAFSKGDCSETGNCFDKVQHQPMFGFANGYEDVALNLRLLPDVNGDGLPDVLGFLNRGIQLSLSRPGAPQDGLFEPAKSVCKYGPDCQLVGRWDPETTLRTTADVNGDGRGDLIGFDSSKVLLRLAREGTFGPEITIQGAFTRRQGYLTVEGQPRMMADVNGDGRDDIVGFKSKGEVQVGLSSGDGFDGPQTWTTAFRNDKNLDWAYGINPRFVMDVNGDGLADLVGFANSSVLVSFSTGKAFTEPRRWADELTYDRGWNDLNGTMRVLGDVNGDHLADIIAFGHRKVHFGVSTGRSFRTDVFLPLDGLNYSSIRLNPRYPADVAGLGVAALIGFGDSNVLVATASAPGTDLLAGIDNGIGGRISVTYRSIAEPSADGFYKRYESKLSYPYREYNAPIYVVTQQRNEDGRGHTYVYDYKYSGAIADVQERGFLGFRSMTVIDRQVRSGAAQPGLASVSYFNQAYPLHNSLERLEIRVVDGDRLFGETRYEYEAQQVHAGVYDVRRKREVARHYSLRGEGSYTTERRFEHDACGRLTRQIELGNVQVDTDDRQVRTIYASSCSDYPATWHRSFLPLEQTAAAYCAAAADGCESTPPLNRTQWIYTDGRPWNLQTERSWVDTDDSWLGTIYGYDDYGNVISAKRAYWTTPNGEATTFDSQETIFDKQFHTFPERHSNTYFSSEETYDPNFGVAVRSKDPNGVLITKSLDGFGRTVSVRGPDPDDNDVVLMSIERVLSPNGNYTETTELVDWQGRTAWQREIIDGFARVYRHEAQADSGCKIVEATEYDAIDRVGRLSLPFYDSDANQVCARKSPPRWTSRSYDEANRLRSIVLPDEVETHFDHDIVRLGDVTVDRLVQTDAAGTAEARSVTTYYNAFDSEIRRDYPPQDGARGNPYAVFHYDRLERLRRIDEPGGGQTRFELDSLGRTTSSISDSSGNWHYEYDLDGLLKKQTDARRQTIVNTYDDIGRLTTETATDADNRVRTRTYFYDQNGPAPHSYGVDRLTRVEDPANGLTHSYGYDRYGNPVRNRLTIDGLSYEIALEYDPLARNTWLSYPSGAGQKKVYDVAGRMESVAFCSGPAACAAGQLEEYVRYTDYTALGKPQDIAYRRGRTSRSRFVYDVLGRVESSEATGAVPLVNRKYAWNGLSLITAIEDRLDSSKSQHFRIDKAGYLASATFGSLEMSYQYDDAGNLKRKDGIEFAYVGNRPVSGTRNGQQVFSALYDENGNMTWKQRVEPGGQSTDWRFTFDAYDRLVEVRRQKKAETESVVGQYVYDYQGHVVKKIDAEGRSTYYISRNYDVTVLPGENGSTVIDTSYVDGAGGVIAAVSTPRNALSTQLPPAMPPEGMGPAINFQALGLILVPLLAGFGIWSSGFTEYTRRHGLLGRLAWLVLLNFAVLFVIPPPVSADLTPGPNGAGIPVAGETLFFHHDQIESTSVVTDAAGNVQTRLSYLPYGQIYEQESHGSNDFRAKFSGREWSDETELYDFGSRYYDPFTGRFLNADSRLVGSDGTSAVSLNRYAYAADNPISYVDPSGESAFLAIAIASAVFVAATVATGGLAVLLAPSALAGGFFGGATVNHHLNPAKWDFKSWKTYGGIVSGIAISEVGEAISVAAPEAVPQEAGLAATLMAGMLGQAASGFLENAAFSALGGDGSDEVMKRGGIGAAFGAGGALVGTVGGRGAGRLINRARQGAADVGEEAAQLGRRSARVSGDAGADLGCSSFVAGTPVHTEAGHVAIEDVEIDDQVYGYDQGTGQVSLFTVTATFSRRVSSVVRIEIAGGEVVESTAEHPFYVEGKGWVKAEHLNAGDVLRREDGTVEVARVEVSPRAIKDTRVHNFEVDHAHTYYVTADEVLTHNGRCRTAAGRIHNTLDPGARGYRTTAVAKLTRGRRSIYVVAGNQQLTEGQLRRARALGIKTLGRSTVRGRQINRYDFMIAADPRGGDFHAERALQQFARSGNYSIEHMAPSRPYCGSCQTYFRRTPSYRPKYTRARWHGEY